MADWFDLEHWCWQEKPHKISNAELFSLAKQLFGKKELRSQEMQQALQQASKSPAKGGGASGNSLENALNRLHKEVEKQFLKAFDQTQETYKGSPKRDKSNSRHRESAGPNHGAGYGQNGQKTPGRPGQANGQSKPAFQQVAATMLAEIAERLGGSEQKQRLDRASKKINSLPQLLDFAARLAEARLADTLQEDSQGKGKQADDGKRNEIPGGSKKGAGLGGLTAAVHGSDAIQATGFKRLPGGKDHQEGFTGMYTDDVDEIIGPMVPSLGDKQKKFLNSHGPASLYDTVVQLQRKKERLQKKIAERLPAELSRAEIRAMIEQLIELQVVSPTFSDTFHINNDRIAYFLAKEAYLSLLKIFSRTHPLRKGTHTIGSRGMADLQFDRTERARHLTSRLAPVQTLRRALTRRVLYPSSHPLEEDDLVEFGSRKKVGYAVVIAIDTSGAVQFGKRIQGVRKACLAFGYYLKKFQPNDRVSYVAYHEVPREITSADVYRLRAINGTGKDIGGCLAFCRKILARDPDRVPAVILIGDGLPVRGDRAGFYQFMDNNRAVIAKAYHHARLLRKKATLFTFLQFRETRPLWQEYADEAAQHITKEAGGLLYRIESPTDIVPSLIQTYSHRRYAAK